MTAAAPAAVERSAVPLGSRRAIIPLHRLAPAVVAVGAAVVHATIDPDADTLLTLGLAAAVCLLTAGLLTATAPILGPRPVPRWYDGAAIALALATYLVRGVVDGWGEAAATGVAMAIALAPGALVVASDVPLWLARRRGRECGVGLGSTTAVSASRTIDTVVLDGLGPLVDGMTVETVDPIDESHLRNLRWFAGALAHRLETPQGRAIARLSSSGNVTDVAVVEHGITGSVDRHPTRLGSPRWIGLPEGEGPWEVVAVEVDGRPLGTVTVVDMLRAGSVESVAALHDAGRRVLLVSEETPRTRAIADLAGIGPVTTAPESGPSTAVLSAGVPHARLRLGADVEVDLEQGDLSTAVAALDLCAATDRAQRRGVRLALAWHGAAAVVVAVGLVTDWAAAILALLGSGAAALVGSATLRSRD